MRRVLYAVAVLSFVYSLATPSALAKGYKEDGSGPGASAQTEVAHTITWWCVDLNELQHVDVPVVAGDFFLVPPDPSPIPNPCITPFPVRVPNGSAFTVVNGWYTNKTYPPEVRAALEASGYRFHSQSPAEDFISKLVEIRVEVRNSADEVVAEFTFDPRKYFGLTRVEDLFAQFMIGPIVDPALGIDLSSDEVGRLPLFTFPVIAGPVPPGDYSAWVYWTLSDLHNDGLGLLGGDYLPKGESLQAPFGASAPFTVLN